MEAPEETTGVDVGSMLEGDHEEGLAVKKKKKKKAKSDDHAIGDAPGDGAEGVVKPKKRKKKRQALLDEPVAETGS